MRRFALSYPLVLLVCWTGLMVAGDYVVVETTVRQCLARNYAVTQGKILQSQMGHGAVKMRGVDIVYRYNVGGVVYVGNCYRYDERNGAFDYMATIRSYPPFATRPVYYNPANPADSVLKPGMDGCDLLLMLFSIPFDIATVAAWVVMLRGRRIQRRVAPAGGVRILEAPGQTRARLLAIHPVAAGFIAVGVSAFAAAFPIVLLVGFAPSLKLMTLVMGIVAATGLAAAGFEAARNASGRSDLCIDEATKTVTLPRSGRRAEALRLSVEEITAVSALRRVKTTLSGDYISYVPVLERAIPGAAAERIEVVSWGWTEERARAFADWLGGRLGVRCNGVEETHGHLKVSVAKTELAT